MELYREAMFKEHCGAYLSDRYSGSIIFDTRSGESYTCRINIDYYHEQRKPGSISEISLPRD